MQSSKPKSATTWRPFFGPTGNADGAAPIDLFDLADGAADCAGCRRDNYRLACLDARDVDEADQGRGARLTDEAETERERLQVGRQLAQSLAGEDDMLAPAELALHGVAYLEIRMTGFDHHTGTAPDHHIADFEGIGVLAVPTAHLSAHVGSIDRKCVRARTWPSAGFGIGASTRRKQPTSGMPSGKIG